MFYRVHDKEEIELFLLPGDYHNAKVLLKSEFLAIDPTPLLVDTGLMPAEKLTQLVRERNYVFLSTEMKEALTEAAEGDARVICSRFGGDEFVVARICEGDAKQHAESYHKRFSETLTRLNGASGKPFSVEASVGVFSADLTDVDSVDRLIELADRLMYNDKARYKRHPRS